MSLFLRLLGEEDKGGALLEAVRSVAAGETDPRVFEVHPASFEQVPGAPFAYWVSPKLLRLFHRLGSLGYETKCGMGTLDDFRFLQVWWESVPAVAHLSWRDYAKGGTFSRFYCDLHLIVNWGADGHQVKTFVADKVGSASRKIQATAYYLRPGLTWPRRTQSGLALRAMPAGCIFADKGPAAFVANDEPQALLALLAVSNSAAFRSLVELQMAFGSYEVGVIQRTPVPDLSPGDTERLAQLARRGWSLKRDLDTATLTSHAFVLPALLQVEGESLDARADIWFKWGYHIEHALAQIQSEIDARCFDLYGFDEADRAAAMGSDLTAAGSAGDPEAAPEADDDTDDESSASSASLRCNPSDLAAELFDWLVGVAFGRFDPRLATGERVAPAEPDPFDPLPVCSPGMLTGTDGLPLNASPPCYPITFPVDGILVGDADEAQGPAGSDLISRVRSILRILAARIEGEHAPGLAAETLEAELCRLLGAKTLGDWLRRPTGFFADHLGRWSKSRRKAPIYWPLSTESGGYTLWIYYPRLTDQTLYTCVNEAIDPKLQEIGSDLTRLRGNGDLDAKTRKRADALLELQREIQALREELLRVARLPYKPDQNDGVLITAAPLWRLFRHKPWQKELAKCWDTLEAGGYDWSHLALSLWPERVRALCRTDKSVAIAHGLEDLYGD